MKVLTLMRHAKSSWKEPLPGDKSRGLSKRGKRDVPLMAGVFAELCKQQPSIYPDLIISSTAIRAKLLADGVYSACTREESNCRMKISEQCYTFNEENLLDLISQVDNDISALMLVGHNPALTELIQTLCPVRVFQLDNLPTSSFVSFAFNVDCWRDVGSCDSVQLLAYDYPKRYSVS